MNRETRLRKVIPGPEGDLIAILAARPASEVDLIVAALRQARRDAIQYEADRKRQRKADARRYRHYDQSQLAARNIRMLSAGARRAAGGDLDALASLADFARHIDTVTHLAVAGLRAGGIPDELIGEALGITRQAVGQRFGRKGVFTENSDRPEAG